MSKKNEVYTDPEEAAKADQTLEEKLDKAREQHYKDRREIDELRGKDGEWQDIVLLRQQIKELKKLNKGLFESADKMLDNENKLKATKEMKRPKIEDYTFKVGEGWTDNKGNNYYIELEKYCDRVIEVKQSYQVTIQKQEQEIKELKELLQEVEWFKVDDNLLKRIKKALKK